MAPHARGRAILTKARARPLFDRLGRRTTYKIAADDPEPQDERLRAADPVAERPQ
jgi:hypothetical protein